MKKLATIAAVSAATLFGACESGTTEASENVKNKTTNVLNSGAKPGNTITVHDFVDLNGNKVFDNGDKDRGERSWVLKDVSPNRASFGKGDTVGDQRKMGMNIAEIKSIQK